MTQERRKRREWEAEFVSEFVATAYPGLPARFHVHLGTYPTPLSAPDLSDAEMNMLRHRMRWADAIVISPRELILIEGKLRASEFLKGLAELEVYEALLPHTPDLEDVRDRPVQPILVTPFEDPTVSSLARRKGFLYRIFTPSFWREYLTVLTASAARPVRPEESSLI